MCSVANQELGRNRCTSGGCDQRRGHDILRRWPQQHSRKLRERYVEGPLGVKVPNVFLCLLVRPVNENESHGYIHSLCNLQIYLNRELIIKCKPVRTLARGEALASKCWMPNETMEYS